MNASELLPIANHLWQSTLFVGVAGMLTLFLRKNRAHTRYCLWLAASAKFLVPFSLLIFAGGQLGRHVIIASAPPGMPLFIEQATEPFGGGPSQGQIPTSGSAQSGSLVVPILIALWATGFGSLVFSWWLRWRRVHAAVRAASPVPLAIGVPVRSSTSFMEPGVFGVFRPVLLLPDGIASQLEPGELQAVLAHELCHVRRRDNLATMMHMVVEALFWFHPLVWWLGARLMEEREGACDEEVVRSGSEPEAYAEGILKMCELYLESPLKCVAGVTGANLKKRIEGIMSKRSPLKLNMAKKVGLAMAGTLAVTIPVILGVINAPALRAQAEPSVLEFEVASIRRHASQEPTRIGLRASGDTVSGTVSAKQFILSAYDLQPFQLSGGPNWIDDRFDIAAKIAGGKAITIEQARPPLQALLAQRLQLKVHKEMRNIPIYALVIGKNGPKVNQSAADATSQTTLPSGAASSMQLRTGKTTMERLAKMLTSYAGRPVLDETGLRGTFQVSLEWTSDSVAPNSFVDAPSLVTAVQEQLGLRLEPGKQSFEVLVIDSVEPPSEN